ncbi:MAG: hypothetical protein ACYC26_07340 [Phycisphaerales bacterium]
MGTSFGALSTDFYVNLNLAVKMDLPGDRETVLHLFDRVRGDLPDMTRFKRYADELALESPRHDGRYQWMAMRATSVRSGSVNPETLEQAYHLHQLILEIVPYFLTISPLDVDYIELMFGFDLECKANQHKVVYDALFADTPMGQLIEGRNMRAYDVAPFVGMLLDEGEVQASFEVKARTSAAQVKANRYRTEPLSVYLTLRRNGPVNKVDELTSYFKTLRKHAERLANDKVVPHLLTPISRVILGSV